MNKKSEKQQGQRKVQAWVALMMYRLAQGPMDTTPFVTILQQIYMNRINNNPIDLKVLSNSEAHVDLAKLVKKKRFKRKSERMRYACQEYAKQINQNADNAPLTIGDIVNNWADFTGQDKAEFMVKVYPEIEGLVMRYGKNNVLETKQAPESDQTEADFKFMQDLLLILIEATPADKKDALVTQIKDAILNIGTTSNIDLPQEILNSAFEMLVSEIIITMENAFSVNPAAKERLLQSLFGALIEIDASKYGWESGVPADNSAKLLLELKEKGLFFNKRTQSRALKTLARRNIFLNLDNALGGTLMDDLEKTILEQRANQQNKTQSIWVCEPISPEAEGEAEKRIFELLFKRRSTNDQPERNY